MYIAEPPGIGRTIMALGRTGYYRGYPPAPLGLKCRFSAKFLSAN